MLSSPTSASKAAAYCVKQARSDVQIILSIIPVILLLYSCTRNVNIDAPATGEKMVVNCLFNLDSSWHVYVGRLVALSDTVHAIPLDNATVHIDGNGTQFTLVNVGGGEYQAPDKKPKTGILYRIEVQVPGYPSVYASDSLPPAPTLLTSSFDTAITYFLPENSFDNLEVNRSDLTFQLHPAGSQYYQILAFTYNIEEDCDYIITDSTIEKLKEFQGPKQVGGWKIPDRIITLLEDSLKGVPVHGKKNFFARMSQAVDRQGAFEFAIQVYAFSEKIRHSPSVYDASQFEPCEIYTQSPHFYNITGDSHSVMGEYNKMPESLKDSATLFAYDVFDAGEDQWGTEILRQEEFWVDIYALSPAMFRYESTHISQLLNKDNPFAEPVQVYSNIHNGTGIFAGYQKERIKVY